MSASRESGTRPGRSGQTPVAVVSRTDCWLAQALLRDQQGLSGVAGDDLQELYIHARGALKRELLEHLRRTRAMRRSRHHTTTTDDHGRICDAVSISERRSCRECRLIGAAERPRLKATEFIESDRCGGTQRGRQHPHMIASQFKAGQESWSKGTRGIAGMHPNYRRTQFKKGSMSGAAQYRATCRSARTGSAKTASSSERPMTLIPCRRGAG
jgi:hypothetical protein